MRSLFDDFAFLVFFLTLVLLGFISQLLVLLLFIIFLILDSTFHKLRREQPWLEGKLFKLKVVVVSVMVIFDYVLICSFPPQLHFILRHLLALFFFCLFILILFHFDKYRY